MEEYDSHNKVMWFDRLHSKHKFSPVFCGVIERVLIVKGRERERMSSPWSMSLVCLVLVALLIGGASVEALLGSAAREANVYEANEGPLMEVWMDLKFK